MKHSLHTTITIDAPPPVVWAVLTDLDAYADWNPFVVEANGNVEVGERLTNRLQPPGGKAMTFKPIVTEVDAPRVFEWLGRLVLPGIFDGRHRFELHPTESGGTRLDHSEFFSGVLIRAIRTSLDTTTRDGFEALNRSLKSLAEARAQTSA